MKIIYHLKIAIIFIYLGFRQGIKRAFCSIFGIYLLCFSQHTFASEPFVVKAIRVEGLQRVNRGTVYNYLPLQIGETLSLQDTSHIIRTLYDTGFFQSVQLDRAGNTLIIRVIERATIASIHITGNTEIPQDKMKEILKQFGLVKGRIFQRAALEHLEKELKQAYLARGKYNARIEEKITPLTENRVAITVHISEGRVARIKEIIFIGNTHYTAHELKSEMTLQTSNFFTYFTKKDHYSKTALETSLESIRSFYLDRGYIHFKIISSQVLLSPDKKDVLINIHIQEGKPYHFAGFKIVGKTTLPQHTMHTLVLIRPGDIFSRKKVTESISAIGNAYGDIGYGFPIIHAEPIIHEKNQTVFINFIVEPGRHVYVRRIQFHGNTKTADYVLRHVIRQNEGTLLSLHRIKESERQLRLLNYFKEVHITTTPIPGKNNQVDLDVDVEEMPSAEANASIGYGEGTGPQFNAAFNQRNFLGTGRSVGLSFNASYWGENYSLNYFNPFYSKYGIGRGLNGYFETIDPKKLNISAYASDRFGGDINYTLSFSEKSHLQFGYGYQGLDIRSTGHVLQIQNFVNLYGYTFQEIRLFGGWSRNSYDQMPYPHQGLNQQLNFLTALAGNTHSFSYYKTAYQAKLYQPLLSDYIFTASGHIAYGNQFNHTGLPFFENYFSGGIAQPGQVRGYDSYSLGPQDNMGTALGGNLLISGSVGLILPYPLSRDVLRTIIFSDVGNVFAYDLPTTLQGINEGPLRYSVGLSIEWHSPIGPLSFSIARPLNQQPYDKVQYFQFSVQSGF